MSSWASARSAEAPEQGKADGALSKNAQVLLVTVFAHELTFGYNRGWRIVEMRRCFSLVADYCLLPPSAHDAAVAVAVSSAIPLWDE